MDRPEEPRNESERYEQSSDESGFPPRHRQRANRSALIVNHMKNNQNHRVVAVPEKPFSSV